MTPVPPKPFNPQTAMLDVGTRLYRVFTAIVTGPPLCSISASERRQDSPSSGPRGSVVYAVATEAAAVAETLVHDIPVSGGILPYGMYARTVLARLEVIRPTRVGILHGLGLRQLGVTAADITASGADTYSETVAWAHAAHEAGLDGLVWMSRLCNDAKVFVFFGDKCDHAFTQDPTFGRLFATGTDQLWLIDLCAPLHVDVLLGS